MQVSGVPHRYRAQPGRKRFNQRASCTSIWLARTARSRDDCKRLMNAITEVTRRPSVCPHDCPSVCALDVDVIGGRRIGRIHGARDQTYTSGVVCAKVARYWERIHHPDRLTQPLRRVGPKGSGQFARIGWDEALDLVADKFLT